jgi:hypothetical protein
MANKRTYQLDTLNSISGNNYLIVDDSTFPYSQKTTIDNLKNYLKQNIITGDNNYIPIISGNTIINSIMIQDSGSTKVTISGNFVPDINNTRSLGVCGVTWKDVFIGPGSLYVNGQQVVSDDSGTIVVSASPDQNIQIKAQGSGDIQIVPTTGNIELKGDISVLSNKKYYLQMVITLLLVILLYWKVVRIFLMLR